MNRKQAAALRAQDKMFAGTFAAKLPEAIVDDLAREYLGIETMNVRNSDSLDFREVYVAELKRALLAAFQAGHDAGYRRGQRGSAIPNDLRAARKPAKE